MSEIIRNIINRLFTRYIFTTLESLVDVIEWNVVGCILSNRAITELICRLSKVRFDNPQISKFEKECPTKYKVINILPNISL